MPEKVVRKTTAKKVVRRTATKTVPARSSVSKTVAPSLRKAPVRVSPSTHLNSTKRKSPKALFIGVLLFIMLLGVSAAIGYSDKGELNVEGKISERKLNATGAEQEALQTVPTQQTKNNLPNGGLVGMGQTEPVPAPLPVATTTDALASTTEPTASSTNPEVEPEVNTEPASETPPSEQSASDEPAVQ